MSWLSVKNACLYILLTPVMTPAERSAMKEYVRERRAAFVAAHFIADPETSKELSAIDEQLDRDDLEARFREAESRARETRGTKP